MAKKRSNYDVVIFDFDGVLINSEAKYCGIWNQLLIDNYTFSDSDIIGRSNEQFLNFINYNGNYELLLAKKRLLTLKAVGEIIMIEELKDLIFELLSINVVLSIASNNEFDIITSSLKNNGMEHCFDLIVSSKDVLSPKPDPSMFLFCRERLGIHNKCLIVEDSDVGILAAKYSKMDWFEFSYLDGSNSVKSLRRRLFEV
jgi:beta-phosphoglucomutase-like phosphatase (HAD superfamily)